MKAVIKKRIRLADHRRPIFGRHHALYVGHSPEAGDTGGGAPSARLAASPNPCPRLLPTFVD